MHRARISEEILQLPITEFFHLLHLSLSLEYKAILPISCTTCLYSILKQQVLQSRFVKASNAEVAVKCGMGGAAPLLSSSCSTVAVLLGRRLLLGVFLWRKQGILYNWTKQPCEIWIKKRIFFNLSFLPSFWSAILCLSSRCACVAASVPNWQELCSAVLRIRTGIRHLCAWRRICHLSVLLWYCISVCCDWVCNMSQQGSLKAELC